MGEGLGPSTAVDTKCGPCAFTPKVTAAFPSPASPPGPESRGLLTLRGSPRAGEGSVHRVVAAGGVLTPHSQAFAFSHQVFHCVHFECPEQSGQKEDNSEESGTGDPSPAGQQLEPRALQAPGGSSLPSSPGSNPRSSSRQHQ